MSLRVRIAYVTVGAAIGALAACSSSVKQETAGASSGESSSSAGGGSVSTSSVGGAGGAGGAGGTDTSTSSGTTLHDAGHDASDPDAAVDSGPPDGTPTRQACTSKFGTAVTTVHGRMDGYLVSIVPPENSSSCNADTGHVHLQLQVNGSIYDVAVNTDTLYDVINAPLIAPVWTEGWHPNLPLDYPTSLSVHSTAFTNTNATAIAQLIETDLANANHLSVYATGYGPAGIHDVHREGVKEDGAIVIDPLSSEPKWMLFRFTTDASF